MLKIVTFACIRTPCHHLFLHELDMAFVSHAPHPPETRKQISMAIQIYLYFRLDSVFAKFWWKSIQLL